MKELFEVSIGLKVSASPLAKGLVEPITKIINKAIPLMERAAEAIVKNMEKEKENE